MSRVALAVVSLFSIASLAGAETYVDPADRFRLEHPAEWTPRKLEVRARESVLRLNAPVPALSSGFVPHLNLSVGIAPPGVDLVALRDSVERIQAPMREPPLNVKFEPAEELEIDGTPALTWVGTYEMSGVAWKTQGWLVLHGGYGFKFGFSAQVADFDAQQDAASTIVQSLRVGSAPTTSRPTTRPAS